MADDSPPTKKRPRWVWVISIYFFLSASFVLFSFYLIGTGAITLDAAIYFSSLTGLDWGLTILIGSANLLAAIALFLLRKVAFYLFAAAFGTGLLLGVWHAATKGWVAAIGGPGLIGTLIGYALGLAVCVYSWRLIQRGVLT